MKKEWIYSNTVPRKPSKSYHASALKSLPPNGTMCKQAHQLVKCAIDLEIQQEVDFKPPYETTHLQRTLSMQY